MVKTWLEPPRPRDDSTSTFLPIQPSQGPIIRVPRKMLSKEYFTYYMMYFGIILRIIARLGVPARTGSDGPNARMHCTCTVGMCEDAPIYVGRATIAPAAAPVRYATMFAWEVRLRRCAVRIRDDAPVGFSGFSTVA